ncbi:MAG TPA: thymidine phosphorylase, partial [Urbifossiella sp.]|nr:thymidine phosphorylase [Urbifossiella sp.]
DVKAGRGAFMKSHADAKVLAESLVRVGTANGLKMRAVLTAMDAPLGRGVGNSLEVVESIETLKGNGPADLTELSVLLAARMVELAGIADAEAKVRAALASGAGLEVFRKCVAQQGGDPRVIDDYSRLPTAPHTTQVRVPRGGFVSAMDAEKVGVASMLLGAGRRRAEDAVDHAVGVTVRAAVGERVKEGDAVFEVFYRDDATLAAARPLLADGFTIGEAPPAPMPLVLEEIG